jgi:HD superfamily phosphohydrolase YqeK
MLTHAAAPALITEAQGRALKHWFLRYAADRVRRYPRHREAMVLKIAHSIRVARVCTDIGTDLGLDPDRLRLAGTIGLLHDVARFEQLIRYGTFVDRVSVDHGALGADLLQKTPLVTNLAATDRAILLHAVSHHNAAAIPKESDPGISFYLQLVRDADKLDIYRVICALQRTASAELATEALQLSDAQEVTAAIAAAIEGEHIAPMAAVRTQADLLLVRLAWVFDLHFGPSVKRLEKAGYIPFLAKALPQTPRAKSLAEMVRTHMARRIRSHA